MPKLGEVLKQTSETLIVEFEGKRNNCSHRSGGVHDEQTEVILTAENDYSPCFLACVECGECVADCFYQEGEKSVWKRPTPFTTP